MDGLFESVSPSRDAAKLGVFIENAVDVQERVLVETLESFETGSPRESGRTICPGAVDFVRGPLGRFPKAVELQSCPVGAAGTIHTHVTESELKHPEHSLPDVANVLFENVTASMVVGTETHDLLLAPSDPDAARDAFVDAIGLEVTGTDSVVGAIRNGSIPDPDEARKRVRRRLAGLFRSVSVTFPVLTQRVKELAENNIVPRGIAIEALCPYHGSRAERIRSERDSAPLRTNMESVVTETTQLMRERRNRNQQFIENIARDVVAGATAMSPVQLAATTLVGGVVRGKLVELLQ